ncbi:hypothetical protein, partial [Flavobacterium sp. LMO6]|uniref:hypothetical protein n=1 Tax=Flavobacterium sp. LMO6 TaxID=2654243 RepID=UPI00193A3C2D
HIFKPLLNAVLYFRNLKNNATFISKIRFPLSNVTQTWSVAQRLVSRNVFSTQSFSAKFGSDFTYHAKFFGYIFRNYITKNRSEAFSVSSENILHLTFRGLKIVAKTQHQAFTNIHKTLNLATAPFQKFPKLAIFLNRCCRLHNIFRT